MLRTITYEQAKTLHSLKLLGDLRINGQDYTHLDDERWEECNIPQDATLELESETAFDHILTSDYFFNKYDKLADMIERVVNDKEVLKEERFGLVLNITKEQAKQLYEYSPRLLDWYEEEEFDSEYIPMNENCLSDMTIEKKAELIFDCLNIPLRLNAKVSA